MERTVKTKQTNQMKTQNTHITILLDRSGSMSSVVEDTVGGFNQFLKSQREVPGQCTVSLFQFDDHYDPVYNGRPVNDAPELSRHTFVPRGSTALLAAAGRAIDDTGDALKNMQHHERPEKVIFVIITDGQENHSQYAEWGSCRTKAALNDKIKHQTDVYKWEFVFIGADQDAIGEARDIGIAAGNAMNYAKNAAGSAAMYSALGSNVRAMRCSVKADMSWTDEQKKAQEEAK
jgi:hypothetical protein